MFQLGARRTPSRSARSRRDRRAEAAGKAEETVEYYLHFMAIPDGHEPRSREALVDVYEFTLDINRHRYDLYTWCESKIYSLVMVNSILFGAIFLVVGKSNSVAIKTGVNKALLGATVVLLAFSLLLSLWHIIPKMDSRVGNQANPRSSIAIDRMSKDHYFQALMELVMLKMIKSTSDQIIGMNKNIMSNQRAIRIASRCTMCGLVTFIALIAQGSFK